MPALPGRCIPRPGEPSTRSPSPEPLSGWRGAGVRWEGTPSPGGWAGGWERVGVRAPGRGDAVSAGVAPPEELVLCSRDRLGAPASRRPSSLSGALPLSSGRGVAERWEGGTDRASADRPWSAGTDPAVSFETLASRRTPPMSSRGSDSGGRGRRDAGAPSLSPDPRTISPGGSTPAATSKDCSRTAGDDGAVDPSPPPPSSPILPPSTGRGGRLPSKPLSGRRGVGVRRAAAPSPGGWAGGGERVGGRAPGWGDGNAPAAETSELGRDVDGAGPASSARKPSPSS